MNKFSNKRIEQLAEQSTKSENCIDLDVITTLDVVNDVKPLDSIGVFVDTYLNFRPFLSDDVCVSLMFRQDRMLEGCIDLEIDDAEKLGELLLFQCKVARRAQEKKRQMIGKSAPEI